MSKFKEICKVSALVCAIALVATSGQQAQQQELSPYDRNMLQAMLHDVSETVLKNYYDKTMKGIDWEANYKEHEDRIKKAPSLGDGFRVIAGMLEPLNDSHTFLLPPARSYKADIGFRMQIIGDRAYVERVRPGTDAEAKLHPGDQILKFNGFDVNRSDLEKIEFTMSQLFPANVVKLQIQSPEGGKRELVVNPKIVPGVQQVDLTKDSGIWKYVRDLQRDEDVTSRYVEVQDVAIVQFTEFFGSDEEIDRIWGMAKKHKTLILDLRGNPGGSVTVLERMVGNAIGHDVKIADRKMRKEGKPQESRGRADKAYDGKIIVLIDSRSASAAELFARVMQLEGRGTVVGDRSAGAVMESKHFPLSQGIDTKIIYACSVTDADLIMKDGKSLEGNGVVPDVIALPSGKDLAEGKDPAMAKASELAGVVMDPASAGKLFPFKWRAM
jgi:carboxyl-terminal processing protease